MAEEKPAEEKKAAPAAKGGKGKTLIILAVVGVLVLGGGGFAAYRYMSPAAKGADGAKDGHEEAHAEKAGTGIVSFEPFVANLADAGGGRFARISVRLIVGNQEEAKEVQENQVTTTRLRSEILDLLTAQTAARLVTPEGKADLRKTIAEHAAGIVKPVKVSDVLFSDFVVQF